MAIPNILNAEPPKVPEVVVEKAQFRPLGEEIYGIILQCLSSKREDRPTADELVSQCERLCYSLAVREFGRVKKYGSAAWGFITTRVGKDVFFHNDSIYGEERLEVGARVWFARYEGGGADRAFPLLKVRS